MHLKIIDFVYLIFHISTSALPLNTACVIWLTNDTFYTRVSQYRPVAASLLTAATEVSIPCKGTKIL